MKKKLKNLLLLSVMFVSVFSCSKSNDTPEIKSKATFKLNLESLTSRNTNTNSMSNAVAIVIGIYNDTRNEVVFNDDHRVDLRIFGDSYISEPIDLVEGDYRITTFHVIDKDGKVIFSTPRKGSENAKYVTDALDISFKIEKDKQTTVICEVMSTETYDPENFGYTSFKLSPVNVIQILVSAFKYDGSSLVLTTGTVSIKGDGIAIHSSSLDTKTNLIIFKDSGYSKYEITVNDGSKDIVKSFTADQLRALLVPIIYSF